MTRDVSISEGWHLTFKLIKGWWLLALCGVLDALISAIYLLGQSSHGPKTYHALHGTIEFLGKLTLAAGICTLAAGVWNSRAGKSFLLVLNGLACSVLGAVLAFWTGPLTFRTIALLIAIMAMSIGVYEFVSARVLRRLLDEWLLSTTGVISIGFAVAFLAFFFKWIELRPEAPNQSFEWLASYFGFSAICMLALTLRPKEA